jgi:hypothetical protein
LSTFKAGSRPRGPGFQAGRTEAPFWTGGARTAIVVPFIAGVVPILAMTGEGIATAGAVDVTPAHVLGGGGGGGGGGGEVAL